MRASITDGWQALGHWTLVAPSLLWSEACAGLRQLEYRGQITGPEATHARDRLVSAQIEAVPSRDLMNDALALARELGWAKTYDAEFVVLARRLDARLLTVDARLAATAARYVRLLAPA